MSKKSVHKSFKLASIKAKNLALSAKCLTKLVRNGSKWEVHA